MERLICIKIGLLSTVMALLRHVTSQSSNHGRLMATLIAHLGGGDSYLGPPITVGSVVYSHRVATSQRCGRGYAFQTDIPDLTDVL